jgi:hypothetical protein
VNLILGAGYAVVGLALIFRAAPLSIRYNAWTTGLRERHPNVNPPPTPEWRGTEYQDHDSYVSGCWCVLGSAFDRVSLAADRH